MHSFRLPHLGDNNVGYLIQVVFARLHTVLCRDSVADLCSPAQMPLAPAERWLPVWSHFCHPSPAPPPVLVIYSPRPMHGSLTPLRLQHSPTYLIQYHLMIVGQDVYRKEGRKERRSKNTFNMEYQAQRNQSLSFENGAQSDASWSNVEHIVLSHYTPQRLLLMPQTSSTTEKALLIWICFSQQSTIRRRSMCSQRIPIISKTVNPV